MGNVHRDFSPAGTFYAVEYNFNFRRSPLSRTLKYVKIFAAREGIGIPNTGKPARSPATPFLLIDFLSQVSRKKLTDLS